MYALNSGISVPGSMLTFSRSTEYAPSGWLKRSRGSPSSTPKCPSISNFIIHLGIVFSLESFRAWREEVPVKYRTMRDLPPQRVLVHLARHDAAGLPDLPQQRVRGTVAVRPAWFLHFFLMLGARCSFGICLHNFSSSIACMSPNLRANPMKLI